MATDLNISPDMINNFINMLKNKSDNSHSDTSDSNNSNTNIEDNNINLDDILNQFSHSANNTNHSDSNSSSESPNTEHSNSDSSSNSIDFETILKIKSIMETLNTKNDPRSNLIYSLKPYLRKSKQAKLDQYVNLLKIYQVSGLFRNDKGDSK